MIPLGDSFPPRPAPRSPVQPMGASPRSQRHAAPQKSPSALHRASAREEQPDWGSYTCEFLVTRVLRDQHVELREELRRLQDLAASAVEHPAARSHQNPALPANPVHVVHSDRVSRLRAALASLAGELVSDFAEEERLYPRLLDVELAYIGMDCSTCTPLQPVRPSLHHTAHRHGLEKKRLDRIQTAMRSFNPTPAAGTADRELWDRLLRFHRLLLTHFHLEDYVLLPRVTRMETELFGWPG